MRFDSFDDLEKSLLEFALSELQELVWLDSCVWEESEQDAISELLAEVRKATRSKQYE